MEPVPIQDSKADGTDELIELEKMLPAPQILQPRDEPQQQVCGKSHKSICPCVRLSSRNTRQSGQLLADLSGAFHGKLREFPQLQTSIPSSTFLLFSSVPSIPFLRLLTSTSLPFPLFHSFRTPHDTLFTSFLTQPQLSTCSSSGVSWCCCTAALLSSPSSLLFFPWCACAQLTPSLM